MEKIKVSILFLTLIFTSIISSQSVKLNGLIIANADVEDIHVINKTSQKFTITNNKGVFVIQAKLNDTLVFSSIQYKLEVIIISKEIIETKIIIVNLIENIYELDEVVVGKVLSGNLDLDIDNSNLERPLNFYDLGIPGNTSKPKTQNERRVFEADAGKFVYFYGLGFMINTNKILNRITGRTKMLKLRVKLEAEEKLLYSIKARLSEDFFSVYPLKDNLQMEFFYFCSDDENFNKRCKEKSDVEILEFLKEKYFEYKQIINVIED